MVIKWEDYPDLIGLITSANFNQFVKLVIIMKAEKPARGEVIPVHLVSRAAWESTEILELSPASN